MNLESSLKVRWKASLIFHKMLSLLTIVLWPLATVPHPLTAINKPLKRGKGGIIHSFIHLLIVYTTSIASSSSSG